MARKLTVYTGKGVGVFDLSARPDMYTDPQAATIVMHDQEEHERLFTESEVRDMINAMAEACDLAPIHYKVVGEHGIVLDPA